MRRLLTVREVAELLSVKESFVRRLIFERRIPVVHLGRLIRIEAAEVEGFIEAGRSSSRGGAHVP